MSELLLIPVGLVIGLVLYFSYKTIKQPDIETESKKL